MEQRWGAKHLPQDRKEFKDMKDLREQVIQQHKEVEKKEYEAQLRFFSFILFLFQNYFRHQIFCRPNFNKLFFDRGRAGEYQKPGTGQSTD